MNRSQRCVSVTLFEGNQVMHVPGFWTILNECNIDPTTYSMTVLDCTPMLGRRHNLRLPELRSVQMAFHVLLHTCMFLRVDSRMLLEVHPSQIPASYRKGYGSGFLLASMMVELFMHIHESGVRQDYRRFSYYREPLVPTVGQTSSLHYYYLAFMVLTYLAYLIAVVERNLFVRSPHCCFVTIV
jgi:hypothetical protein